MKNRNVKNKNGNSPELLALEQFHDECIKCEQCNCCVSWWKDTKAYPYPLVWLPLKMCEKHEAAHVEIVRALGFVDITTICENCKNSPTGECGIHVKGLINTRPPEFLHIEGFNANDVSHDSDLDSFGASVASGQCYWIKPAKVEKVVKTYSKDPS